MKRFSAGLLFFLLSISLVLAANGDDWNVINNDSTENFGSNDSLENNSDVVVAGGFVDSDIDEPGSSSSGGSEQSTSEAEMVYTTEFYIALGVGAIGIIIILYLIQAFLRSPKNKW